MGRRDRGTEIRRRDGDAEDVEGGRELGGGIPLSIRLGV